MQQRNGSTRATVIYRATTRAGRDVELRLAMDAAEATVADAWRRLTAVHPGVDPFSLEIECRRIEAPRRLNGETSAAEASRA